MASTLAMLEATKRRHGLWHGLGRDGRLELLRLLLRSAWLWQGKARKAAQVLYANHASPTLVWREDQSLKGQPFKKVGDMPHNWASAEFIQLVIHLLALDRGEESHLLEGFPRESAPGMVTRLNGITTPFGPLKLTWRAARSTETTTLKVISLAANCKAIVVHLPGGTAPVPRRSRYTTLRPVPMD